MFTKNSWLLSLIIILLLVLAACGAPTEMSEPNLVENNDQPVQAVVVAAEEVSATAVPLPLPEVETEEIMVETAVLLTDSAATLSNSEIEALQFMREEEKLAHDVYLMLYDQWGLPIFQNIASSEQVHTDIILALMQRYEIPDAAADLGPGQFANNDLQALYDQLVASGSQSLADALRVGALVEETDIADLESRLAVMENGEISQAFNNLLQGSRNHLRSYVNMLERQTGEVYQPQLLSAAAYADILAASPNGMGGQNQGGSQGQGNGRGNGQGNGGGNS